MANHEAKNPLSSLGVCAASRSEYYLRRVQGKESAQDDGSRKLEIRKSHKGETVVQGQITVPPIKKFEDVLEVVVWNQSLSLRACRNTDTNNMQDYGTGSHIIANIEITSTNITTGSALWGSYSLQILLAPMSHKSADLTLLAQSPLECWTISL